MKNRLEYLRNELRNERISAAELIELQNLVPFIEDNDVELLEAAGVPEFIEVQIPFDGFYQSFADATIDSVIEGETEHYQEEHGIELDWDHFRVDREKFAQMVPSLYSEWLEKEHSILIELSFSELVSPREYNFSTDRIYCNTSFADLRKLYTLFTEDTEDVQERIDARFKSRSSFASFYDEFCTEWKTKPLHEWDQNELSVLFPEPDWAYFYDDANCNGEISECIEIENEQVKNL